MTAQELSTLMKELFEKHTPEEKMEMEKLRKEMEAAGVFRQVQPPEK